MINVNSNKEDDNEFELTKMHQLIRQKILKAMDTRDTTKVTKLEGLKEVKNVD